MTRSQYTQITPTAAGIRQSTLENLISRPKTVTVMTYRIPYHTANDNCLSSTCRTLVFSVLTQVRKFLTYLAEQKALRYKSHQSDVKTLCADGTVSSGQPPVPKS